MLGFLHVDSVVRMALVYESMINRYSVGISTAILYAELGTRIGGISGRE